MKELLESRFTIAPNGCWVWWREVNGPFPVFGGKGKPARNARRTAWEVYREALKPRDYLFSKCGNSACINPDHCELVPFREWSERLLENRPPNPIGDASKVAILSTERVKEIFELRKTKLMREIAAEVGVSISTISRVLSRKRWSQVALTASP